MFDQNVRRAIQPDELPYTISSRKKQAGINITASRSTDSRALRPLCRMARLLHSEPLRPRCRPIYGKSGERVSDRSTRACERERHADVRQKPTIGALLLAHCPPAREITSRRSRAVSPGLRPERQFQAIPMSCTVLWHAVTCRQKPVEHSQDKGQALGCDAAQSPSPGAFEK